MHTFLTLVFLNFLLFISSISNAQLCKAEEKYGYAKEVYNNKGEVVTGYYMVIGENGKYGICDSTTNLVIPTDYEDSFTLNEGWTIAMKWDDKVFDLWNLKTKNKIKLPTKYTDRVIGDNGYIAIQAANEKWGYCDKSGKIMIQPKFDSAEEFVNGKAIAQTGEKNGIIDEKGSWLIQPKNVSYRWVTPSVLLIIEENEDGDAQYGFMDDKGNTITPLTPYKAMNDVNGFIEAKTDNKNSAFYNYEGKKLTGNNCQLQNASHKANNNEHLIILTDESGKAFVMDSKGNKYLENKYMYIYNNIDYVTKKPTGFYTVETKPATENEPTMYAVVKLDGTVILDGRINDIVNYDNTYFFTGIDENGTMRYNLLKIDGNLIAKDVCNAVIAFHRQFTFVKKNGLYGVLNFQTGEWIVSPEYSAINKISDCSIVLIDKSGNSAKFDQDLKIIK